MRTQTNTQIIEQMWVAWNEERGPGWLGFFDEGVVWTTREDEPDAGVYQGHQGLVRLMTFWFDNFDDLRSEADEFIDVGDHVVVPSVVRGKGKVSGAPVELPYTFVYMLRDGKIVEVREYLSKQEALVALGAQADSK